MYWTLGILMLATAIWLGWRLSRAPVVVYADRHSTRVYVKRWTLLWKPSIAMCVIHRFFSADPDDPHNHIGHNLSIVLGGEGVERCYDSQRQLVSTRRLARGSVVWRTTDDIHCIDSDEHNPLLTLFVLIPKLPLDRWGFFTRTGFVSATSYCKKISQKKASSS